MTISDVKIQQILTLIATGVSQTKACKQIGVAPRTFIRLMKASPELKTAAIDTKNELAKIDLENIIKAQRNTITELVDRADPAKLKLLENNALFALESKLSNVKDKLNKQLGIEDEEPENDLDSHSAEAFIKALNSGPVLRPGKAVITRREVETTLSFSDDDDDDVIDLTARDAETVEEQQQS